MTQPTDDGAGAWPRALQEARDGPADDDPKPTHDRHPDNPDATNEATHDPTASEAPGPGPETAPTGPGPTQTASASPPPSPSSPAPRMDTETSDEPAPPAPDAEGDDPPLVDLDRHRLEARAPWGDLEGVLRALQYLVDKARVIADPVDGLVIEAVDPAHVAFARACVPPATFERWNVSRPFLMGWDVATVYKRGKARWNQSAAVRLGLVDGPGPGLSLSDGQTTRTIGLVDPAGMSRPKTPDLELDVEATLPHRPVYKTVKAMQDVADHVAVEAEGGAVRFLAEGERDRDRYEAPDPPTPYDAEGRALYSLDYLEEILKGAKYAMDGDEIRLRWATDYPSQWKVLGPGGVEVTYLLAPRIESE